MVNYPLPALPVLVRERINLQKRMGEGDGWKEGGGWKEKKGFAEFFRIRSGDPALATCIQALEMEK